MRATTSSPCRARAKSTIDVCYSVCPLTQWLLFTHFGAASRLLRMRLEPMATIRRQSHLRFRGAALALLRAFVVALGLLSVAFSAVAAAPNKIIRRHQQAAFREIRRHALAAGRSARRFPRDFRQRLRRRLLRSQGRRERGIAARVRASNLGLRRKRRIGRPHSARPRQSALGSPVARESEGCLMASTTP